MKPQRLKWAAVLLLCAAVAVAVALMGRSYLNNVSRLVYEESTNQLMEVYHQVNYHFVSFLERNWKNLDDWNHQIEAENDADIPAFLDGRKDCWSFTQFCFVAKDGSYISHTGEKGQLELKNVRDRLFRDGMEVMSNETLPTGQAVTTFAIPVAKASWNNFTYSAIAISYTNDDMINALSANAFSGQSTCFVVDTGGDVFLSTQQGGSVFGNYLSYLQAASDLSESELKKMQQDWEAGTPGVVSCQIGGVDVYLCYQGVGYQDCVLLGIVPQLAASASLLQIQAATIRVLVSIFVLLVALLLAWLIYTYRQKTKKSAVELQYRDMMFDTLSITVDDIFLMLNAEDFHVDFLSANVERLLGIPHKTAKSNIRVLGESVAAEHGLFDPMELSNVPIHGNMQWEREHIHQQTGERRWYRDIVYHENIQGTEKYLVIMADRTQERQMNQKLQELLDAAKSANAAKSRFLSNMSHDIRTPMNAVVGFSALLAKNAENPGKVLEYARKISSSSQYLLSLINDVLDMSKIENEKTSLNVNEFSLPNLLEDLYMILLPQAKAKRQAFELRLQGKPAERLLGDRLRLNQVLTNLLSNAIKYTPTDGHIDFLVEGLPSTSPQIACLRFSVKDDGIGMSKEFLGTVFDPFVRESNSTTSGIQGTGLGMAITKNLVELMGGTIAVESTLGQGSVFTTELSFALPAIEEDKDFWVHKGITRVLAADDEQDIRDNIRDIMRDTGVSVTCVADGASAVEAAVEAHEQGEAFHAILLDWKMPNMDGLEAANLLRKKLPAYVPILVMTSYDWGDIEQDALQAGIDAFLPKPFFLSSFQHVMESMDAEHVPETLMEEKAPEHVLEGMLFLVAEDNELNAEILSEMLNIEHAKCEVAVNGKEALALFQNSDPDHFDMILMDVQMPVMGGYEATRAIRACAHPRAKTIPIIAMTANAFAEDVQDALQAGMDAHLAKPIDMDAVKAVICRLRKSEDI